MATFPSITPTYGIQSSAPNIRKVQFGDGYESRFTLGLNQDPKVYNLTFECQGLIPTRSKHFWTHELQILPALTTPPGEGSSQVCLETWSKSIPYLNRATIQATFRQVFEP